MHERITKKDIKIHLPRETLDKSALKYHKNIHFTLKSSSYFTCLWIDWRLFFFIKKKEIELRKKIKKECRLFKCQNQKNEFCTMMDLKHFFDIYTKCAGKMTKYTTILIK